MANWNRFGIAAGLAGALALGGTAWAQSPGAANNTGTPNQGTTESESGAHGTRSGWSGSSATEPSDRRPDANQAAPGSTGSTVGEPTSADTASGRRAAEGSSASTGSSAKLDKGLQEDLQKIHAANQAEVHMGRMGAEQATSSEVKSYAQQLEQDHQQMDEQLTQTAQTMGAQLEGKKFQDQQKDAQKDMKKLQGKTGADFDKQFVKMMVKDHEKDIKEVQKVAKDARKKGQTELASTLDQAVTKMQAHLQTAKQLEQTVGKGKSAHGSPSSSTGSGSSGSSSGSEWNSNSASSPQGSDTAKPKQ